MKTDITRCFLACVVAGIAASPIAVLLWPLVLLKMGTLEGAVLDGVLAAGLIAVACFTGLIGLGLGLVTGFPLLLGLHRLGKNSPSLVAFLSAMLALTFCAVAGGWSHDAWPLYAFVGLLGAVCGAVASMMSRSSP